MTFILQLSCSRLVAFSFGQPSVDSVLSKFLSPGSIGGVENVPEASCNVSVSELSSQLTQVKFLI